ncbi:hypothetical protein AMIS_43430 [Actinoplanes missouriensis 431]|uniref:Integral membrane protein n=1 Tax=Actinoplanes missouriensis (strain ATCC 14538 / DSM 43046 / CBS 188.64 / JCM 3121 / NBRC 102363 / NCIMB 12654 / NRRL B-3342 / UNCC 431) TaxID=512565 RepID=I0H976_ACTM4|nr:hypothetical protein [Actinoplanes missouriensis]BAL89563.1 hypothetical protein AMIS_43430 [Actinoplanes missouriensis 431]
MLADHLRDAAVTAAVFGFFASSWFGWAQEAPPPSWRKPLIAATVVSLLTAVAGGLLAWRHASAGTVFDDATSRTFGIVVGIEFAAAGVGAVILAVLRRRELIPVWIAFVVGVHLFPVAVIIHYPAVHVTAALITLASLVAVPVARSRSLPVSAVIGVATGAVLLAGALFSVAVTL